MSVKVIYSNGNGKGCKRYAFIRPERGCFNRSRRVDATEERIAACIKKWFTPMNYYLIDGHKIGSNSPENALKEYWRVCEISDVGGMFDVVPVNDNKQTQ